MVGFEKRNGQGLIGHRGLMEEMRFELCLGNQQDLNTQRESRSLEVEGEQRYGAGMQDAHVGTSG